MVTVRRAREDDADELFDVHIRSIREVCSSHYSERETQAWAGRLFPGAHLPGIRSHDFFVAEDAEGLVGFSELVAEESEVRAVYVHPRALRAGVGSALLYAVEDAARAAGLSSLRLSASLNAVPFYQHAGYRIEYDSSLALNREVSIVCVEMRKELQI